MGLRWWVTIEKDTQPDLPKKKVPKGVLGEGKEEEGGKDLIKQ